MQSILKNYNVKQNIKCKQCKTKCNLSKNFDRATMLILIYD